MNYYIPFRTLDKKFPSITLHKNSENFDTEDTGKTSNDVFLRTLIKKQKINSRHHQEQ